MNNGVEFAELRSESSMVVRIQIFVGHHNTVETAGLPPRKLSKTDLAWLVIRENSVDLDEQIDW